MTDAELRTLAQIERQLVTESPELRLLFDGAAAERRRRRRVWGAAGLLTVLVSVALLGCGIGLGLPGLAVSSLCPPIAFAVVLLGVLLAGKGHGPLRRGPGRRR